jgi:hypothetical protein
MKVTVYIKHRRGQQFKQTDNLVLFLAANTSEFEFQLETCPEQDKCLLPSLQIQLIDFQYGFEENHDPFNKFLNDAWIRHIHC